MILFAFSCESNCRVKGIQYKAQVGNDLSGDAYGLIWMYCVSSLSNRAIVSRMFSVQVSKDVPNKQLSSIYAELEWP